MNKKKLITIVAMGISLLAVSCVLHQKPAAKVVPQTATIKFENEPEFTFAALNAMSQAQLHTGIPFLLEASGTLADPRCFEQASSPTIWETKNPQILERLQKLDDRINQTLLNWSYETLLPKKQNAESETNREEAVAWTMQYELPTIAHVDVKQVRISDEQKCIDPTSAKLPLNSRLITTLFGAKRFKFSVSTPYPPNKTRKLKKAARKAGMHLEATLFEYKKLIGEDDKPLKDKRGRVLYGAPDGKKLIRKKIPSPKKRPAVGFTLTMDDPLYFAYGNLPQRDIWARETVPQQCTVNLVFDDVTPRAADCDQLPMVGFGVERTQADDEVKVKVAAEDQTAVKTIALGKKESVIVAGRYMVWIESKPIVEGAQLFIDSLILDPANRAKEPPSSFAASPEPPKQAKKNKRAKHKKRKKK